MKRWIVMLSLIGMLWHPPYQRYTVHCQAVYGQTPYREVWLKEGLVHDVAITVLSRRPPNAARVCIISGYIPYRQAH